MNVPQFISREDARVLVGKMLFGSDWIAELTKEQRQLLGSEFGVKRKAVFQAEVMVNTIDVYEKPCPPKHRDRFNAAVGCSERMRIQGTTVDDWIETVAGLDCTKPFFERPNLDEAMKRYRELQSDTAGGVARRPGPEPVQRDRVAKTMREAITTGKLTIAALKAEKEETLASDYSAGRETVRNARNLVVSEFAETAARATPTNTDNRGK
jgi:hypothetical protein